MLAWLLLLVTLPTKRSDQFHKGWWQLISWRGKQGINLSASLLGTKILSRHGAKRQPVNVGALWLLSKVMVPLLEVDDLGLWWNSNATVGEQQLP